MSCMILGPHSGNYEDCSEVIPCSLVKCTHVSDGPAAFIVRADTSR
jgi:hypothetical protein